MSNYCFCDHDEEDHDPDTGECNECDCEAFEAVGDPEEDTNDATD
jgi:hypothetical protein